MGRIPTTMIPVPVTGTNRIHKTLLAFTDLPSPPSQSPPRPASPTRSDLENAYGDSTGDPAPEAASDQLMSLEEILAAPAATQDDDKMWSRVEEGVKKEGYGAEAAALLASLEEVAGLQGAEKGQGKGKSLARRLRKKLSRKEISLPVVEGGLGWMGAVMEGTKEIEKMAVQARKEGRDARVEQIALRVQKLLHSSRE